MVEYAEGKNKKNKKYHQSFTGHSLGGYLAEASVVLLCNNINSGTKPGINYPQANAVVFDSPGFKTALYKRLKLGHYKEYDEISMESSVKEIDVISYLGTPNTINANNDHIGSMYLVGIDLRNYDNFYLNCIENNNDTDLFSEGNYCIELLPSFYHHTPFDKMFEMDALFKGGILSISRDILNVLSKLFIESSKMTGARIPYGHGINNFVDFFENYLGGKSASGFVDPYENSLNDIGYTIFFPIYNVVKYPHSPQNIRDGIDFYYLNTYVDTECHCRRPKSHPNGKFYLNSRDYYQISNLYDPRLALPLKHFGKGMQKFIKDFSENFWKKTDEDRDKLYKEWLEATKSSDDKIALNCLVNLKIVKDNNENDIVHLDDIEFENLGLNTLIHKCRSKISKYLQDSKTYEILLSGVRTDLCTD